MTHLRRASRAGGGNPIPCFRECYATRKGALVTPKCLVRLYRGLGDDVLLSEPSRNMLGRHVLMFGTPSAAPPSPVSSKPLGGDNIYSQQTEVWACGSSS